MLFAATARPISEISYEQIEIRANCRGNRNNCHWFGRLHHDDVAVDSNSIAVLSFFSSYPIDFFYILLKFKLYLFFIVYILATLPKSIGCNRSILLQCRIGQVTNAVVSCLLQKNKKPAWLRFHQCNDLCQLRELERPESTWQQVEVTKNV